MRHPFVIPCASLALLVLAGQGIATADTLTYEDGNQIWLAAPDGSAARAVTSDGTAERPWSSPSTDASGRILAARYNMLYLMSPSGQVLGSAMGCGPGSGKSPRPSLSRRRSSGRSMGSRVTTRKHPTAMSVNAPWFAGFVQDRRFGRGGFARKGRTLPAGRSKHQLSAGSAGIAGASETSAYSPVWK